MSSARRRVGLLVAVTAFLFVAAPAAVASAQGPSSGTSTSQGPNVKEYRVHSDLTLNLGKGVSGSVNGTDRHKCVNADGGFAFDTKQDDEETHDLWIDASTSVIPPCFQDESYMYFNVHVSSPYEGDIGVNLSEQSVGGAYKLDCNGGTSYHLACKQTGDKAVTITCSPEFRSGCQRVPSDPTMSCTPEVYLTVGQVLHDQHVCTSTGRPLPKVTTEGSLPDGLTWKRWPTDQDTWIVVNGTVDGPQWSYKETVFVAAPDVADTVHWHVQPRRRERTRVPASRGPGTVGDRLG